MTPCLPGGMECQCCHVKMEWHISKLCASCRAEWHCKECLSLIPWNSSHLCDPCYKRIRFNYKLVRKATR